MFPRAMDDKTAEYYAKNAEEVFRRQMACAGGVSRYFLISFPRGSKVLDIGAGSGRDLLLLLDSGYDAFGVEPCTELREVTTKNRLRLSTRLADGELPTLNKSFGGNFDGILCSAVLMHIPKEQLFDSVFAIRKLLKPGGRLLLSVPSARPGLDDWGRDTEGRLFILHPPDYLQLLLERTGFQLIGRWEDEDGLGREGYKWATLLFELRASESLRPIDQVEGILSRDRKVATYKFALFRALCDIAMTGFNMVSYRGNGQVGVPLSAVAERWLLYYWPIIESKKFIPQVQGESPGCQKPVAFRTVLGELVSLYAKMGGLPAYVSDYRSSSLGREGCNMLKQVEAILKRTIVSGPVTYAGGALETGRIFQYDRSRREILFSNEIWREMSLMGHWINDAIILRWAKLTSRFGKKEDLKASEVVDLLLKDVCVERDVQHARKIYASLGSKVCVWSGRNLGDNRFDVDHVMPFSMWRNNDLWNLLPVDPKVNSNKKDKIPTRDLLFKRRDCVVEYWRILRDSMRQRFDHEVSWFVSDASLLEKGWEGSMFNSLMEAVEVTALQRGCERWEL